MRKLSNSGALTEARRFKTLTLGRGAGSGSGVAMPQPTAQNQMIIASATPAWTLLAAPSAQGQVPIAGADPYTPAWGTTFPAVIQFNAGLTFGGATGTNVATVPDNVAQALNLVDVGGVEYIRIVSTDAQPSVIFSTVIQFDAGLTFGGATGVNIITVPDSLAQAAHLVDAGGIEYLRVVSTDAQPVIVFNEGSADIDFRWESNTAASALFLRGSDGFIGVNMGAPTTWFEIEDYVTDYPCMCVSAGANGEIATVIGEALRIGHWNAATTTFTERVRISGGGGLYVKEGSYLPRLSGVKEFVWTIPDPAVGTAGQIRIPWACTVIRVDANTVGGTSCTFNIEERGTLGSSGTNVLSSDMAADSNGESVTSSFNNSSLAAGNYLTIDVSAVSGAVDEVNIALTVVLT